MNMQTKILAALTERGEKAGLDVVQNADYSNTGTVLFQNGFHTELAAKYDFQVDHSSITFKGELVDRLAECDGITDDPPNHRYPAPVSRAERGAWFLSHYTRAGEVEHMLTMFEAMLEMHAGDPLRRREG